MKITATTVYFLKKPPIFLDLVLQKGTLAQHKHFHQHDQGLFQ